MKILSNGFSTTIIHYTSSVSSSASPYGLRYVIMHIIMMWKRSLNVRLWQVSLKGGNFLSILSFEDENSV